MQTITSAFELKNAIQNLEVEQAFKGQELKQEFRFAFESLKPSNLLIRALNDITHSSSVLDNIIGTGTGLLSGFISKKIFVGTSANLFRKLLGSFLQFGVSKLVANNPDAIKAFGQYIFKQYLFFKDRENTREEE